MTARAVLVVAVLIAVVGYASALRSANMQRGEQVAASADVALVEAEEVDSSVPASERVEVELSQSMSSVAIEGGNGAGAELLEVSGPTTRSGKTYGTGAGKTVARKPNPSSKKNKVMPGIRRGPNGITKRHKQPTGKSALLPPKKPRNVKGPNDNARRAWRKGEKERTWKNGNKIPGVNPKTHRTDVTGRLIKYDDYGKRTGPTAGNHPMGWEIDHKKALFQGGTNEPHNLHPLQSTVNAQKSSKLNFNYNSVSNTVGVAPQSHPNLDPNSPRVQKKGMFVNPENGGLVGDTTGIQYKKKKPGFISKKSPAVQSGDVVLKFVEQTAEVESEAAPKPPPKKTAKGGKGGKGGKGKGGKNGLHNGGIKKKTAAKPKRPRGVTGPNDNVRRAWRKGEKEKTWKNGKKIPGANPKKHRMDVSGRVIRFDAYGKRTGPKNGNHPHGWEIDHNLALAQGGTNEDHNLHPLQATVNAKKGKKLNFNYNSVPKTVGQFGPKAHPNLDVQNSPRVKNKGLFVNPEDGSLNGNLNGINYKKKKPGYISKKSPAVTSGDVLLK